MGSEFKGEILKEKTAQILKQWHAQVRDRRKNRERILAQSPPTIVSADMSHNHSPSLVSSHNSPSPMPAEANYISNISEITEEREEQSWDIAKLSA